MAEFELSEQKVNDEICAEITDLHGYKKILKLFDNGDIKTPEVAAVDFCVRREIFSYIRDNANNSQKEVQFKENLTKMIRNTFQLYAKNAASPQETFSTFQMIFDMICLKQAESVFPIFDDLSIWLRKYPDRFTPLVKNSMLRLCNDLLRRLSATGSRDIQFSGKIQLFLTRLFPIDEKSALNLTSSFHLENQTVYRAVCRRHVADVCYMPLL